ncbi:MAG: ATP-binding cassette domain-containing protein [Deltaproteobacteria bacterium]|nr:ATP-binding cassette domain-containing protein [Deltaproteobacteria bacterium]MBW2563202.1 ATP-binding cassette domain-containing protein [Deltaproteobacteria bacterium]
MILKVKNISIRHQDNIIFPATSWQVKNGENWAIIGENGSGKSNLIRAICGRLPLAFGKIEYHFLKNKAFQTQPYNWIETVSFTSAGRMLQKQGGVYQSRWNSFMNDEAQRVSDFLCYNNIHKINPYEIDRNLPDKLGFLQLEKKVIDLLDIRALYKKKIIQLSNGELRKILIAKSLLKNPEILIFDNPFTGLDQVYLKKLDDILENLIEKKIPVILLLNDAKSIPGWVTHLLWVKDNKIVAKGRARDVLSDKFVQKALAKKGEKPIAAYIGLPVALEPEENNVPEILVKLCKAKVIHGEHQILDSIDWEIKKGQHWVLMGPNGSGKSTLLSLIMGDNPQAYANEIYLFGKKRGTGETIWDIKNKMGFVAPELQAYYPIQVTAFNVVCSGFFDTMGVFKKCTSAQLKTALKWMRILNVVQDKEKRFGALSKGEQRIILLARALVKKPKLLILDEPCQDLDAANISKVLTIVEQVVQHSGTTLIFVTHIPDEIPGVITHRLVLEQGKVLENNRI